MVLPLISCQELGFKMELGKEKLRISVVITTITTTTTTVARHPALGRIFRPSIS